MTKKGTTNTVDYTTRNVRDVHRKFIFKKIFHLKYMIKKHNEKRSYWIVMANG